MFDRVLKLVESLLDCLKNDSRELYWWLKHGHGRGLNRGLTFLTVCFNYYPKQLRDGRDMVKNKNKANKAFWHINWIYIMSSNSRAVRIETMVSKFTFEKLSSSIRYPQREGHLSVKIQASKEHRNV